eukprot:1195515-Prorocentrum_minimum.AAC.11
MHKRRQVIPPYSRHYTPLACEHLRITYADLRRLTQTYADPLIVNSPLKSTLSPVPEVVTIRGGRLYLQGRLAVEHLIAPPGPPEDLVPSAPRNPKLEHEPLKQTHH